jgi:hypothetical protein
MFHGEIYVSMSADKSGTMAFSKHSIWTDESMDIVTLFWPSRQRCWKHRELNVVVIIQRAAMLCKSEKVVD